MFSLGSLLPYCLDWGPEKHSAYQSAYPDSESVARFGTRTRIWMQRFLLPPFALPGRLSLNSDNIGNLHENINEISMNLELLESVIDTDKPISLFLGLLTHLESGFSQDLLILIYQGNFDCEWLTHCAYTISSLFLYFCIFSFHIRVVT